MEELTVSIEELPVSMEKLPVSMGESTDSMDKLTVSMEELRVSNKTLTESTIFEHRLQTSQGVLTFVVVGAVRRDSQITVLGQSVTALHWSR